MRSGIWSGKGRQTLALTVLLLLASGAWGVKAGAQSPTAPAGPAPASPPRVYLPIPGFDLTSIDATADPCNDFYKFACGKFAANHPIPADQTGVDQFYALYNVNTQALRGILEKAAAGGPGRSPDEQKIGDFYHACMDRDAVERKGLEPVAPLLAEIDGMGNGMMSKLKLPAVIGRLQRDGADVFFSYGEQQDFKDATKQIAAIGQGGLGLPEKDYYLRTGAKDETIRQLETAINWGRYAELFDFDASRRRFIQTEKLHPELGATAEIDA